MGDDPRALLTSLSVADFGRATLAALYIPKEMFRPSGAA